MKLNLSVFLNRLLLSCAALLFAGCSGEPETPAVFVKAEPAVDAVLERHPRTLRVYLNAMPNTSRSALKLTGPRGEEPLSRFHTMGADDLMIEIDGHPLPNGEYTVEYIAAFEGDTKTYTGRYNFTVDVSE